MGPGSTTWGSPAEQGPQVALPRWQTTALGEPRCWPSRRGDEQAAKTATQGRASLGIKHRPSVRGVHGDRRRRDELGTAELQTQEQGRLRASGRKMHQGRAGRKDGNGREMDDGFHGAATKHDVRLALPTRARPARRAAQGEGATLGQMRMGKNGVGPRRWFLGHARASGYAVGQASAQSARLLGRDCWAERETRTR
jgi:hypothetical protein